MTETSPSTPPSTLQFASCIPWLTRQERLPKDVLPRMGLAAVVACHRLRVASPEVLQLLRWRYWALPGVPPFIHTAAHAASAPPPCLRGSGGCAGGGRRGSRGIPSGSGSIAGCTTASRMALRGGWNGFTPAHQPLHRAGDAGGHDLKTTSWLRHMSSIHGPGQRTECPVPL